MVENVLEICKVTPPLSSPTDISLPLTFFDLQWLRYPPADMLLFYESPHPEPLFRSTILPKLKHSLSLTLRHFLPLAGNIIWSSSCHKPVIRYKEGDGVLLNVVSSDVDFDHISGKNIRECSIFRPLVSPILGSDSQAPVFVVKITIFPNKGYCIGLTAQHGVFDGKSVAMFIKAWAWISKFGELSPELTPIFDRKLLKEQYADIENSYIEILKQNGFAQNSLAIRSHDQLPGRVRGTFELPSLDVKKLKELLRHRFPYVSTFTVTYAYIILCIVKTKGLTNDNRVFVGFPADIRRRLEPQVPANYFGNCIGICDAMLNREDLLGKEGLAVAVDFISKSIKSMNNKVIEKIAQSLPNAFKERSPNDKDVTRIYVVSSNKFGFEHIDFGWGIAKKVNTTQVDKMSAVTFTDLENGGVEVELSLKKDEMGSFSSIFAQGVDKLMKDVGVTCKDNHTFINGTIQTILQE